MAVLVDLLSWVLLTAGGFFVLTGGIGALRLPTLFQRAALNPARILDLPGGRLAPGAPADLVLFDPDAPFLLDRETLLSRSKNTPFDRTRMQGRVAGTWVGGERVFGDE